MITAGDFASLINQAEDGVIELAVDYMTSYGLSGAARRDTFTEHVLMMLEALTSNRFNPDGSFTEAGARQALDDEAIFRRTTFDLRIRIYHRLLELEKGEVNFNWLEKKWASSYRPMLYATGNRRLAAQISAGIKKGDHQKKAPPRKYVSLAVTDYSPELAANIDQLLMSKLPLRRV